MLKWISLIFFFFSKITYCYIGNGFSVFTFVSLFYTKRVDFNGDTYLPFFLFCRPSMTFLIQRVSAFVCISSQEEVYGASSENNYVFFWWGSFSFLRICCTKVIWDGCFCISGKKNKEVVLREMSMDRNGKNACSSSHEKGKKMSGENCLF